MKITLNPAVLAEGKAVCKQLYTAYLMLPEEEFQERLSDLMIDVAAHYCGRDASWKNVKALLVISGVEITPQLDMMMQSMEDFTDLL